MNTRTIFGIAINLLAVLAPVYWLYETYGMSAAMDPNAIEDLLALVGSTSTAFILGLIASRASQRRSPEMFDALSEIFRATSTKNRRVHQS
jgi:hypothetical protein